MTRPAALLPPAALAAPLWVALVGAASLFGCAESPSVQEPSAVPTSPPPSPSSPSATTPTPGSDEGKGLLLSLRPGRTSLAEAVEVTLVVENPAPEAGRFCDYHTPFEGIRNDIFEVTGPDGKALAYRGMMAKRAPPGPDDYVAIGAGQRLEATVDLRDAYALTPGLHRVRYAGFLGRTEALDLDVRP